MVRHHHQMSVARPGHGRFNDAARASAQGGNVDRERGTMGEQGRLAIAVATGQSGPVVGWCLRQPLLPLLMPRIDRLGRRSFRQSRRLRREP